MGVSPESACCLPSHSVSKHLHVLNALISDVGELPSGIHIEFASCLSAKSRVTNGPHVDTPRVDGMGKPSSSVIARSQHSPSGVHRRPAGRSGRRPGTCLLRPRHRSENGFCPTICRRRHETTRDDTRATEERMRGSERRRLPSNSSAIDQGHAQSAQRRDETT